MARYGYRNMRTPIVEPTALFVRGLGEVTDIVEKEMYSFEDAMNGDQLTLRPEATAGIVRAMIEHNALVQRPAAALDYMGPMFRHERPQKGRYRQFHQLDVEALGFAGPDVDAELILMGRALWRELGLVEGRRAARDQQPRRSPTSASAHRAALIAYFEQHADVLDEDARRRLHSNPLRILDTKNPAMQALVEAAPKLIDFLGEASLAHFDAVRAHARSAPGSPTASTRAWCAASTTTTCTVFEWVTDQLGAQGTVCGGGRYDGLIEQLGGKPTPAVGWGLGIERVLLLLEELRRARCRAARRDAYAVVPDAAALAAGAARPARRCARPASACRCTRGGEAGQHEVAVQARRRQRRALCADLRRRRARAGRGHA